MNIKNLSLENADMLMKNIEAMRIDNPKIEYNVYEMEEESGKQILINILNRVENIEGMLRLIFGNHILLDGHFIDLALPREKPCTFYQST